jgi:Ala-tRNA(Pro) deacylase
MNVATFLEEHNCRFERLPHEPTYSAQRLAQQLHVPGREIAKTVLLRAGSGNQFVVAVLPGSRKIDFEKVAKLFGNGKVQLATEFEIAAHCPDCEFGVLPPFGSRYGMKTIVDSNLAADEEIVFDANTHNEAIRMRFNDFVEFEDPLVAAIAVSE